MTEKIIIAGQEVEITEGKNFRIHIKSIFKSAGMMYKRIIINGETYLVPIEDIILDGIRGIDVPNYPKVKS